MGCNPFTTGLLLKRPLLQPRTFDPNASDSESEAEEPARKVQKTGNKNPTFVTDVVSNFTKSEGRKVVKKKKMTKRDARRNRLVPRVDNWIPNEAAWPDLAADAKAIHDLIPEKRWDSKENKFVTNQTFGATTIVCAVFETDRGYRKYAFSNLDGAMSPELRGEAHRLGYHVIKGMKSHAEGEMIQYAHTYKHRRFVSMGCDKAHCAECTYVMRHYFGEFHTQTAISDKVFTNYYMPEPLTYATGLSDRPSALPGWAPGMMPTPVPAPTPAPTPVPTITPPTKPPTDGSN